MMKDEPNMKDRSADDHMEEDQTEKVGLKSQREEESSAKKETRWKKVSAVLEEAHKAYKEGAGFGEVIATLIETLESLAKSEVPKSLGGLGINDGPEMDLPSPEEPAAEEIPEEE